MSRMLRPVLSLLLSAAVLLMGNGLQTILIPVRGGAEGFSALEIGLFGASYYGGLLSGCLLCPQAIARVGHVRSFTAFTAIATLAPLLHAIHPDPVVWSVLRFLTGVCIAGLIMVIESWLNGASTNATRGTILSIYTVINLTVVAAGQMMLGLGDPKSFELFSLVAILTSLAAVPVSLSRSVTPQAPKTARLRLLWLYRVSPVGLAGCFATGLANGAFWSLGPIFASAAALPIASIALFMTAATVGGALLQWPAGYLSDRIDRRRVLLGMAVFAALSAILLASVPSGYPGSILALAALFGSGSIPIYAVSVAHANDFTRREDAVDVSSGLLLSYSIGAVIGPLLASALMAGFGPASLFIYTALMHILFAAFVVFRIRERTAPPPQSRDDFIAVPKTSPAVFNLDPRTEADGARASTRSVEDDDD